MTKHTAFITGAGQNIGRAIAVELARRKMNLVLVGRTNREACENVAAECGRFGVETLVLMGDVGDRNICDQMTNQALAKFGVIDVLVPCVAMRPNWPFLETTYAQWSDVMNVNVNSVFWMAQAFLPGMIEQGWGRIIGFTGMHAIRGAHKAPTVASKHAQWGLIKALSHEFSSSGITANILSPGPIGPVDPNPEPDRPAFPKLIPMGRRGLPEEVAVVAGMLASEECSYLTGQMIAINGGGTT